MYIKHQSGGRTARTSRENFSFIDLDTSNMSYTQILLYLLIIVAILYAIYRYVYNN